MSLYEFFIDSKNQFECSIHTWSCPWLERENQVLIIQQNKEIEKLH